MAKYRQLDTGTWDGREFHSMSVEERYLYLYCKLNKHINTAGCCNLSTGLIALETGLTIEQVSEGLRRMEAAGVLLYKDDWLVMRNANDGLPNSKKIRSAIDQQVAEAPPWVGEYLVGGGPGGDARAKHPAIVAVRELAERYPPKDTWDAIIETVGDKPDLDRLIDAWMAWARKGYNPTNLNWIFEWYRNGVPETYGKISNSEALESYREI